MTFLELLFESQKKIAIKIKNLNSFSGYNRLQLINPQKNSEFGDNTSAQLKNNSCISEEYEMIDREFCFLNNPDKV